MKDHFTYPMNVLITGATGFIGREIVSELANEDWNVFQAGNRRSDLPITYGEFFSVDITNREDVLNLRKLKQVDVVVHSAGLAHQFKKIEKAEFTKTNVEGTRNILELAVLLKVKHFVLISSTAIYGTKKKSEAFVEIVDEAYDCNPQTYYAQSKLEAEKVAKTICEHNKINLTIFRLSPVIGEDNSGNVARMIEAIDKKRFVWIGRGENYKSLIYKKDVARACRTILKDKKDGTEIFNLAAAPILMSEFVAEAAKYLNRRIPKISISPILLEKFFRVNEIFLRNDRISKISGTIEKWLSDDVYSAQKIEREYDFKPETAIVTALKKQIDSYIQQKEKK